MKDFNKIIDSAKTIVASMNPKKAEVASKAEVLKKRASEFKATSKNEAHKATQQRIIDATNKRLDNYTHKVEKDDIDYRDLTVEVTHAKYNASLLELDGQTVKYVIQRNVDLASAVNESREYKKRLKHMLTACAHKDASKLDKALAALQAHMKATQADFLTVAQIQDVMNHSTPTQANYFKRFAHILGVVSASRSNAIPMDVNKDNEVYKDFIAL